MRIWNVKLNCFWLIITYFCPVASFKDCFYICWIPQDIRMHYVSNGAEDKPLMLLVHGFPEFWYSWRHQLREFKDKYRWELLVYFDYSVLLCSVCGRSSGQGDISCGSLKNKYRWEFSFIHYFVLASIKDEASFLYSRKTTVGQPGTT